MRNLIVMLLVAFLALFNTLQLSATENETVQELCFDAQAPPDVDVISISNLIKKETQDLVFVDAIMQSCPNEIGFIVTYTATAYQATSRNKEILVNWRRHSHNGKFSNRNYINNKLNSDNAKVYTTFEIKSKPHYFYAYGLRSLFGNSKVTI